MAPDERHTPCHDVIQGTCRIRRSGLLPGPIAARCVVDSDYISPLLLRAQLVSQMRRMTPQHSPRPPSHQCLSRIAQKQNPRTHLARPERVNNSSAALASVSLALPLPAPAGYIPALALARYLWFWSQHVNDSDIDTTKLPRINACYCGSHPNLRLVLPCSRARHNCLTAVVGL